MQKISIYNMIILYKQKKEINVKIKLKNLNKNIEVNMIVKKKQIIEVTKNVQNVKYFVKKKLDMKDFIQMLNIEIKIIQYMEV